MFFQIISIISLTSIVSAQYYNGPTSTTTQGSQTESGACCAINACNYEKIEIVQKLLAMASGLENSIKAPAECHQQSTTTAPVTSTTRPTSTMRPIIDSSTRQSAGPGIHTFTLVGAKEDGSDFHAYIPPGICYNLPEGLHHHVAITYGQCYILINKPDCLDYNYSEWAYLGYVDTPQEIPATHFDNTFSVRTC